LCAFYALKKSLNVKISFEHNRGTRVSRSDKILKLFRTHSSLMGRREELGRLDESDLFMELIRDVANELDINILCHKILVNVGLLTHADRGSLFLAKGPLEDRYLVAKLFDVTQDTELEEAVQRAKNEEIKIPFGVGIAGYVAQTKEIINIKDAYKVSPHSFRSIRL